MYKLYYTNQAKKDAKKLVETKLKNKAQSLLGLMQKDPYAYPPEFEFLQGDLKGAISRRINKQHRLVYQVIEEEKVVKVIRMWTHYE